jgi:hypothetical protein
MNLEELTRLAWGLFENHVERSIERADGSVIVGARARDEGRFGFSIHCARFFDRQGIGVVTMVPAAEIELAERHPDDGENFLAADFLATVKDNHAICLNCGRNAGTLRAYLAALFAKAGLNQDAQLFELPELAILMCLREWRALASKVSI